MKNLARKQFRIPIKTLHEAKKLLSAKTETETVIKSLELAIKQKKLEEFANLSGNIKFNLTLKELEKMRRD